MHSVKWRNNAIQPKLLPLAKIMKLAGCSPCFSYLAVSRVKLVTLVKGDSKAPFSIATTTRCRVGHYSLPWIAPLYPRYVPYTAEC